MFTCPASWCGVVLSQLVLGDPSVTPPPVYAFEASEFAPEHL